MEFLCTYVDVCVCVCLHVCVCVCVNIHSYIYIYIYIYIYDSFTWWRMTFPLAKQCITRKSQTLYSWNSSTSDTFGRIWRIHVVQFSLKLRIYDITPSRPTKCDDMTPSHSVHCVKYEGVVSSNSVSHSVYTTHLLEIWLDLTTRLLHMLSNMRESCERVMWKSHVVKFGLTLCIYDVTPSRSACSRMWKSHVKESCRQIRSHTLHIRRDSWTSDQMWWHQTPAHTTHVRYTWVVSHINESCRISISRVEYQGHIFDFERPWYSTRLIDMRHDSFETHWYATQIWKESNLTHSDDTFIFVTLGFRV